MIEKKGKSIASKMSNSLSKKSFGGFFVFLFSILIFIPSFSFADPGFFPETACGWDGTNPSWSGYSYEEDNTLIQLYKNTHGDSLPDYYFAAKCSDVNRNGIATVQPDPYTKISAGPVDVSVLYGLNIYKNGVSVGDYRTMMDNGIYPPVKVGDIIRIVAVSYDDNSVLVTPPNNSDHPYQPRWQSSYNINDLTCNQVDLKTLASPWGISPPAGDSFNPSTIGAVIFMPLFSSFEFSNKASPAQIWVEPDPFNTASFDFTSGTTVSGTSGAGGNDITLKVTGPGTLNLDVVFWPLSLDGKLFYSVPMYNADKRVGSVKFGQGPMSLGCNTGNKAVDFVSPLDRSLNNNLNLLPSVKYVSPYHTVVLTFDAQPAAPVSPLACNVTASDNPVIKGNSTTLTANPSGGSGTFSYKWYSGNDTVGTVLGTNKNYTTANLSLLGNQTWTVQVKDPNNPSLTPVSCSKTVSVINDATAFSATCAPGSDPSPFHVVWTASPVGGTGSYTYSWSGSESLSGNTKILDKDYFSTGSKTAIVTVQSGVQSVQAVCNVTVNGATTGFDYSLSNDGNKSISSGDSVTSVITANLLSGGGYMVGPFIDSIKNSSGTEFYNKTNGFTSSFYKNKLTPTESTNLTLSSSGSTPTGAYTVSVKGDLTTPTDGFYHCLKSDVQSITSGYKRIYYACAPKNLTSADVVNLGTANPVYPFVREFIYTDEALVGNFLDLTSEQIADSICGNHTWSSPSTTFSCNSMPSVSRGTSFNVNVTGYSYPPPTLSGYPKVCGNGDIYLSWNKPTSSAPGASVSGYQLFINDNPISLGSGETSYVYHGTPDSLYNFYIKSIYSDNPSTPFITSQSLGGARNNYSGNVGMVINVGSSPLTVTSLGRFMRAGNSGTHTVKLVNANTGAEVGSVTVNMAGGVAGELKYTNLSAPVTLLANTKYYLVSSETNGGDYWYNNDTTVTPTSVATVQGSVYYSASPLSATVALTSNHSYGPVGFIYSESSGASVTSSSSNDLNYFAPKSCSCAAEVPVTQVDVTNNWLAKYTATGYLLPSGYYNFNWSINYPGTANKTANPFVHPGFPVTGVQNGSVKITDKIYTQSANFIDLPSCSVNVVGAFDYSLYNLGDIVVYTGGSSDTTNISAEPIFGTKQGITLIADTTGLPSGINFNLSTNYLNVGTYSYGTSIATASADNSVTPGTYSVTVRGLPNTSTLSNDKTTFHIIVKSGGVIGPVPLVMSFRPSLRDLGDGKIVVNFDENANPFVTDQSLGGTGNINFSGYVGMKFTVGASPLTITSLGRFMRAGNTGTHTVKLIKVSDSSTVASADINMSGGTVGQFKYAPLGSTVTLSANTVYYLVTSEISGGDSWYNDDTTVTPTSVATVQGSVYYSASPSSATVHATANHSYGLVSFLYRDVPKPFVTGQTLTLLRSNWSGYIGMQFTVGASPLSITSLGRYMSAGDSHTHNLKIVKASDNSTVASVDVNMAGGTVGQFKYAPLGSTVTLSANTKYFLVSQEVNGGDKWSSDGTILTTTGDASVNWVVYNSATDPTWHFGSSASSYGPLNFTYTVDYGSPSGYKLQWKKRTASDSDFNASGHTYNLSLSDLKNSADFGKNYFIVSGSASTPSTPFIPLTDYAFKAAAEYSGGLSGFSAPASATASGGDTPELGIYCSGSNTPFITSQSLASTRHDYTGNVGMVITIGSSPLTVTSLGRFMLSGNTGTHIVRLIKASDGSEVGAVTVNMSGGEAGKLKYVNLTAPVTLLANTKYYLVSSETLNGDFWYNQNTTVTTSGVATVNSTVYYSTLGPSSASTSAGGSNHSYGPVGFIYSDTVTHEQKCVTDYNSDAPIYVKPSATYVDLCSYTSAPAYVGYDALDSNTASWASSSVAVSQKGDTSNYRNIDIKFPPQDLEVKNLTGGSEYTFNFSCQREENKIDVVYPLSTQPVKKVTICVNPPKIQLKTSSPNTSTIKVYWDISAIPNADKLSYRLFVDMDPSGNPAKIIDKTSGNIICDGKECAYYDYNLVAGTIHNYTLQDVWKNSDCGYPVSGSSNPVWVSVPECRVDFSVNGQYDTVKYAQPADAKKVIFSWKTTNILSPSPAYCEGKSSPDIAGFNKVDTFDCNSNALSNNSAVVDLSGTIPPQTYTAYLPYSNCSYNTVNISIGDPGSSPGGGGGNPDFELNEIKTIELTAIGDPKGKDIVSSSVVITATPYNDLNDTIKLKLSAVGERGDQNNKVTLGDIKAIFSADSLTCSNGSCSSAIFKVASANLNNPIPDGSYTLTIRGEAKVSKKIHDTTLNLRVRTIQPSYKEF